MSPIFEFGLLRLDVAIMIDLDVRVDVQVDSESRIYMSPENLLADSVLSRWFHWSRVRA